MFNINWKYFGNLKPHRKLSVGKMLKRKIINFQNAIAEKVDGNALTPNQRFIINKIMRIDNCPAYIKFEQFRQLQDVIENRLLDRILEPQINRNGQLEKDIKDAAYWKPTLANLSNNGDGTYSVAYPPKLDQNNEASKLAFLVEVIEKVKQLDDYDPRIIAVNDKWLDVKKDAERGLYYDLDGTFDPFNDVIEVIT